MTASKTINPNMSSVVGLYVTTLDKNGGLREQGWIIGRDGNFAIVQFFSWIDGSACLVKLMSMEELRSSRVRLYAAKEEWQIDHARLATISKKDPEQGNQS